MGDVIKLRPEQPDRRATVATALVGLIFTVAQIAAVVVVSVLKRRG